MITKTFMMVVALVALIGLKANAGGPLPAQVGIVNVGGTAYGGGSINYSFDLNALVAGQLIVKSSIKAPGWKVKLPVLMATPGAGMSTIAGPFTPVPAGFTGNALMTVQVKYAGKTVAKRTFLVTIGATPPVASSYSFSQLDVGFNTLATLDGTPVPTTYMTNGPVTYAWTQTGGAPATLSSTSVASPTFTTGPLTDFVDLDESFGEVGVVGLDAEQVTESTYNFQLLVSDGSIVRTGLFSVACASLSPAQPNMPIGVNAYFKNETTSTNWTLISKPPGSTATLQDGTSLTPRLRPDMVGVYVVKDEVSGTEFNATGATYTGVGLCNVCHGPGNAVSQKDMVTPWSQTGHATFFQRSVDGESGAYYGEGCIYCHTVGYNKAATADNGGFDDVAKLLGWSFPSSKVPGTYDAMPAALKDKANIQCESCHGPGSQHPGPTSVSLNVAVCSQCHQDGHYHVRVEQWENSPHFKGFKEVSEEEGENASCSRCHSPNGYVNIGKRVAAGTNIVTASATSGVATGIGELICQGCHDPHHTFDNPDRHQLRIFDDVVIGNPSDPSPVVLTNQGAAATCLYCHNSRRFPLQLSSGKPYYTSVRSGNISGPHESTVAEVLNGLGAVTYGVEMGNTFHTYGANCITCHMYPNPAAGSPDHNKLGDHTFSMTYMNGTNEVQNIAACNQCHAGAFEVDDFDFKHAGSKDWDGTNGVQGIQSETTGLLDAVRVLLNTTGVSSVTNADGAYTGFSSTGLSTNATIKDAQLKTAWNWMLINRDHSKGVHNPQFTIRLLQTTWTDLSTNWTGSATNTFKNTFPNAVLR